ncbi:hypothetical protein TPELB_21330 [Terrisporobacter petrolearius]|uniref:Immunity protein Imm3 n=1 Tax=Terrisporobacter petrolearius TaxID=1460447 RepID=A0ABZ3FDC3_9FIRM
MIIKVKNYEEYLELYKILAKNMLDIYYCIGMDELNKVSSTLINCYNEIYQLELSEGAEITEYTYVNDLLGETILILEVILDLDFNDYEYNKIRKSIFESYKKVRKFCKFIENGDITIDIIITDDEDEIEFDLY